MAELNMESRNGMMHRAQGRDQASNLVVRGEDQTVDVETSSSTITTATPTPCTFRNTGVLVGTPSKHGRHLPLMSLPTGYGSPILTS